MRATHNAMPELVLFVDCKENLTASSLNKIEGKSSLVEPFSKYSCPAPNNDFKETCLRLLNTEKRKN